MKLAVRVKGLSVAFGKRQILRDLDFAAPSRGITVLAGRSGSGKTTLLRSLNRLNETYLDYSGHGLIELDLGNGLEEITGPKARPVNQIRRLVGMVFQTPNVLPVSIARNLALPMQVVANIPAAEIADRTRAALAGVGLWDEVADRLDIPANRLSGGQQQRLCLARALALAPEILLLDEPTASLDVRSSHEIEELLLGLAERYPLIVVSHNPEQAVRLADSLIVMANGQIRHVIADDALKGLDVGGLVSLLENKTMTSTMTHENA